MLLPNVLTVVDVRYPCPEESRLIKKGGNGAIYGATYGRYEFAVIIFKAGLNLEIFMIMQEKDRLKNVLAAFDVSTLG